MDEIHCVLHYLYLDGVSAGDAAAKVNARYGAGKITRQAVSYWYAKFNDGLLLLDKPVRPGRPQKIEYVDAVKSILDDFPFASARFIASEIGASPATVLNILVNRLGLQKRHFRWVPHVLSDSNKIERMNKCSAMLHYLRGLRPIQKLGVLMGDESWFFYDYPEVAKYCAVDEELPAIVKRQINDKKIMIFCCFNAERMILIDALPQNAKFNSTYMCDNILEGLRKEVLNDPKISRLKGKILQIDNARPHVSKQTSKKIEQIGFRKLDFPAYSPDVQPCDFFLFGYVKSQLKNAHCTSDSELINKVVEICQKIDKLTFSKVYDEWLIRLQRVIDNHGDYLSDE